MATINEFFGFKIGDVIELISGQPTTAVLKILEIRVNEGARTGYFTCINDHTGEKYQVTGKQLRMVVKSEDK